MNTAEWLDHAKKALDLKSDYQLSKALETSRARISHYRTGTHTMDDALAVRLAELLEIPPARILADMNAERATDPKVKKAWNDLARSIAAALAVAIIAGEKIFHDTTLYIMLNSRWKDFPRSRPLHSPYNSKKWSIRRVGIPFPMQPYRTEPVPGSLAFQSHHTHHNKLDHERRTGLRDRRA